MTLPVGRKKLLEKPEITCQGYSGFFNDLWVVIVFGVPCQTQKHYHGVKLQIFVLEFAFLPIWYGQVSLHKFWLF